MRRLILIALVFTACTKTSSNNTPHYSVSASINGTPTTFDAVITVDSTSTPGADSANLTPLLEITLSRTGAFKPGTYPFTDSANGPLSQLGYTLWRGGAAVEYPAVSDTVILSAVNHTWLSGTFQGTCEFSADSVVSVTNGHFTVGWNEQ